MLSSAMYSYALLFMRVELVASIWEDVEVLHSAVESAGFC